MLRNTHQFKKKTFKYLILGSNGLLGKELKKILPPAKTLCIARNASDINIDLINFKKLEKVFENNKFVNVINSVAITDLHKCQKNITLCDKINFKLVQKLNQLSKKFKFKLVHISTDLVYVNKKNLVHKENDTIGYSNNYAKTKFLCEKSLRGNLNKLVIRTNFTGFKKKLSSTFIGWLFENIKKKKKINLFNDLYCSTIDVKTCALIIKKLMLKNCKGVFNLGTSDSLTKKEFAVRFAKKLKKKIYYDEISAKNTSLKKPLNLTLNINKIERTLNIKMISSIQAINNLIKYKI
jgi:dTDP-4-dehydrorhamnose reductase